MALINATNLTKSYTVAKPILDNIDFSINEGQKIALVAKNGAGKSTFLKVLTGEEDISDGKIEYKRGLKIGFLSQSFNFDKNIEVIDILLGSEDPIIQVIKKYEKIILQSNPDQNELNEAIIQLEHLKAWEYEYKIKIIIGQLQINKFLTQKIGTLSGGELKRIALAKVLVEEPEFLILDEPTNHLDLEMIEWLENYLKQQNITLLLVTHDRYFLERVCNEILELDRGKIYKYGGNYSYFLEKKAERMENEKLQLHKMKQLYRNELSWIKKAPGARRTKQNFRQYKFYELQENYKTQKDVIHSESLSLDISMGERQLGNKIIKIKNLNKKFGEKLILKNFTYEFRFAERVGIIGKNGVGKSTFVNMLIGQELPDSGIMNIGETLVFGYYHQKEIDFPHGKRIIDIVRDISEFMIIGTGERLSASTLLERFLFPASQQYMMADSLSGGEKRRLFLLTILMKNPNFLILDEPTNDLDLLTIGILEEFLLQYQGCLVIISHDRFFMDRIVDHLFVFEGEGVVKDFWGTYSEYKEMIDEQKITSKDKKSVQKVAEESYETSQKKKMSYQEKREFDQLEREITKLEKRKEEIGKLFENPELSMEEIQKLSEELGDLVRKIEEKETRWFELSE